MNHFLTSMLILMTSLSLHAQVVKQHGTAAKVREVATMKSDSLELNPSLIHLDQKVIPSAEYGNKKDSLNKLRALKKNQFLNEKKETRGLATAPSIIRGFQGNLPNSIPSDNDIAVSNAGKVVSVVNSNIRVYNDTGRSIFYKLVTSFFNHGDISDPRVIYDPKEDRFIMTCFSGNLSTESIIHVAFSKTNDPAGGWNFYKLNGASFNDSTWSDYPIISVSDKDFFITFNQVKDNVSWTVGFKQSVIWQIDKQSGYQGDSLDFELWSNITYNGGNLRNICPAKYQTNEPGDNMYFLSVRNVANQNDSIFLLEITNSLQSGKAELKTRVLKSPIKYGFPPNARQKKNPTEGNYLMTNDARVLAAIYENDQIHFGSNSINTDYTNAAVFLGNIKDVSKSNPSVTAKLLSTAQREYGYPAMTYLGKSNTDHRILYTFSHCITDSFPGTSMIYKDAYDNWSDIIPVKEGTSTISRMQDSTERWGDYTNIQKLYNNPDRAYLVGSWGKNSGMDTWINLIENKDSSEIPTPYVKNDHVVFPNPIINTFSYQFSLDKAEQVSFELFDLQGKRVALLLEAKAKQGKNLFSFQTNPLPSGQYIFKVSSKEKSIGTQHVLIR